MSRRPLTRRPGLGAVAVVLVVLVGAFLLLRPGGAPLAEPAGAPSGACAVRAASVPGAAASQLPVVALCALPVQAAQVWREIEAGGPFADGRDGIVFDNRERRLPTHASGWYHEYTVATPGADDRGARRLVTGGVRGPAQELYWSDDHYSSFSVVDPSAA